jgi:hypothetical protein
VSQGKDFVEVGRKDPAEKTKSRKSLSRDLITHFLKIEDPDLDGQKVNLDLLDDLLTSSDIDSEIDKCSVMFMLMSSMEAHAEERYENEKINRDKIFGELDSKARDGDLLGRPTDAKVKAWIEGNVNFRNVGRRVNKFKRQMKKFRGAALAIEMKSRMLQTKSANIRKIALDMPEAQNTKAAKSFNKKKKQTKGDT